MEFLNRHFEQLKSDHFSAASPFCGYDYFDDPMTTCGEEQEGHEWAWDEAVTTSATLLSKHNREVRFHPGYSSGTAAVRGDSPLLHGRIYYWEIKMLTALYGTDVSLFLYLGNDGRTILKIMADLCFIFEKPLSEDDFVNVVRGLKTLKTMVGVGTKNAQLDKSAYQFCSLLGSDKESWGFSYTGKLQHNGKTQWYGPPFGKGCVIGIYLDMWKGTLEFFLNRRPLGVAFKSLQGLQLYPMVCSTAAQSAMRVTVAVSHPVDLKLLSLRLLCTDSDVMKALVRVPGIRRYLISMWWILSAENQIAICEVAGSHIYDIGMNRFGRKRPPECEDITKETSSLKHCIHQDLPEETEKSTTNTRKFRHVCLACDIVL